MKKLLTAVLLLLGIFAQAQIGIGTTSPNSTLDVRGSLSVKYTAFSVNTTAGSSDNTLVFTGTSAVTLTLPDATTCQGRTYWIKNTSSNSSILSIVTTSSQTIDGVASWSLTQMNKAFTVISNGANWIVTAESLPGGNSWTQGGNSVTSLQNLGTTSNYDLPFITNNTEKMRLTALGNLGIGISAFDPIYPEKLLVNAGVTSSFNLIEGHGKINNYLQINIQNDSSGAVSSSDVIATSNNGSEVKYYVDMGINSSGNTQNFFGGANDAYLYAQGDTAVANTTGGNLYIGTSLPSRDVAFLTGGGTKSSGVTMNNERMRILSTGNVGINTNTPAEKLDITGNLKFSGALMPGGTAGAVGTFLISTGTGSAPIWFDASGYAWLVNGNTVASEKTIGTAAGSNFALPFITNGTEKMRISNSGDVAIGTATFNGSFPEQLLVNAASPTTITDYQNVIVGKGNTNSYAQLNIQNTYSAAANSASSDLIATSDNGNESVNYIDMGINSGTNTTSGIYGGGNTAYLYSTGNDFALGNATVNKNLLFFTGGTASINERMRIDGLGNVGIGTTSPTSNLHVANSGSVTSAIAQFLTPALATTNATYLKLGKSLSNGDEADIMYNWTGANSPANYLGFSFYGNSVLMAITNGGNVGIGTTGPTAALHLKAGTATASTAPLKFTAGTKLTTSEAGAIEFDGVNTYVTNETTSGRGAIPVEQHFLISATGTAISTIANYFGATSNIPLVSGGYYEIEIDCYFLKSTAGTVTWTFTNSAAPTSMNLNYDFSAASGIVSAPAATDVFGDQYNLTTTAPTVVSASLTNAVNHHAHFSIILLNGTGTSLKIQATCSAGTITPGIGSRWYSKRISTSNVGAFAN